jgi:polygalacturonase
MRARTTLFIALLAAVCGPSLPRAPLAAAEPGPAPVAVDVTRFGAVGDGATLDTAAIQHGIDACAARGGGTLVFPAGRYVTGTVQLKDNVTLRLDGAATLLGSVRAADYRNVDPFTAGDGVPLGYALVVAIDARNVAIEGTGTIDGQGKAVAAGQRPYAVRPFLLRWIRCRHVRLADVTLRSPGAWTNHFSQCGDVAVTGVTIRSVTPGLKNTDGIDVDGCDGVRIERCDIDSGDDAICLKTTRPVACRDVSVTDCKLRTRCNAIKIGTESLGDFERIRASRCTVVDCGMAGVAVYAVDGGHVRDVTVSDVDMDGVDVPVSIRLGARLKTFHAGDAPEPTGTVAGVTLRNLRVRRAKRIGLLVNGIPGHPVDSLVLDHIDIQTAGGCAGDFPARLPEKEAAYPEMSMFGRVLPAWGAYLRHVRGASVRDVRLARAAADVRPAVDLTDVQGPTPADFAVAP